MDKIHANTGKKLTPRSTIQTIFCTIRPLRITEEIQPCDFYSVDDSSPTTIQKKEWIGQTPEKLKVYMRGLKYWRVEKVVSCS